MHKMTNRDLRENPRKSKQKLRERYGFKTIQEARRFFKTPKKTPTASQAYEALQTMYNSSISKDRARAIKRFKTFFKQTRAVEAVKRIQRIFKEKQQKTFMLEINVNIQFKDKNKNVINPENIKPIENGDRIFSTDIDYNYDYFEREIVLILDEKLGKIPDIIKSYII